MIGRLIGSVVDHVEGGAIVFDVGGVGYELFVPLGTVGRLAPEPDGRVTIHVHTHLREDALTLFGFATAEDRLAFRTIIGVSGIGPKTGLAVLGALPAGELARAVAGNDLAALTRVPGVGKKTAERMVLELRDKLSAVPVAAAPAQARAPAKDASRKELLAGALTRMGYRPGETERAIVALGDAVDTAPLPDLVREALRVLSK